MFDMNNKIGSGNIFHVNCNIIRVASPTVTLYEIIRNASDPTWYVILLVSRCDTN